MLRETTGDLAHPLIDGSLGLLLEWFLMGFSFWSNLAANPLPMLAFQVGMFAIIIPLIIVGYSVVAGLLFKRVVDLSRNPQTTRCVNATGKRT
jgi:hypothetical protein